MSKDCCGQETIPKSGEGKILGIDSFLFGAVIITALIFGGVLYFGSKMGATSQIAVDNRVKLKTNSNRYSWGIIKINGGIVSKSFPIKNEGEAPLKIYDVKTSCMCTTAQLKTLGQLSKKFGMHEKSGSVFTIKPGQTAELIVEFNPAYHGPSGIGPISRTVTMNTNDPKKPTLSFYLTAKVVRQ